MKNLFKIISLLFLLVNARQTNAQTDIYDVSLGELLNYSMNKAFVLGLPHPHSKGEYMVSYQFMSMGAAKIHNNSNQLTPSEVLANFEQTPTAMSSFEHMFMGLYAPSDKLSFMFSGKIVSSSMDMEIKSGGFSNNKLVDKSSGLGDLNFFASYLVLNREANNLLISAGFSIPTGSISLKNEMSTLPYSMQTGTGTFDPSFSITYLGSTMKWSWGGDLASILRLYNNNRGYKLGNLYQLTLGGAFQMKRWFSVSAKIQGNILQKNNGKDDSMNESLSPLFNSQYTGNKSVNTTFGTYFRIPDGFLKNNTFSIDYKQNIYENMNGIQLAPDRQIFLTWQWIFGIRTIK